MRGRGGERERERERETAKEKFDFAIFNETWSRYFRMYVNVRITNVTFV